MSNLRVSKGVHADDVMSCDATDRYSVCQSLIVSTVDMISITVCVY